MLSYDIFFADIDEKQILQLPFPPQNMPELAKTFDNQEFKSWGDGLNVNVLGNPSLVTFTLQGILPQYPDKYSYARSQIKPYDLINLWSLQATAHKPLRCVMTRPDGSCILSWQVTVESKNWYEEQNGDINYKVEFKQYSIEDSSNSLYTTMEKQKKVERINETIDFLNNFMNFLKGE